MSFNASHPSLPLQLSHPALSLHSAAIKIKPQHMIGDKGGAGAGPGGVEVAHVDWSGTCILEVDGTQEQATLLVARMTELTPYRILREKSRPGKLWLR